MNQDKVSIVIPCYNAQAWIDKAISSALNQSWMHKEVIVIDDGSTDGSLKVIKTFGAKVTWNVTENRGGGFARNLGVSLASGKWIQFLDSDDELVPDCIEKKMLMPEQSLVARCCKVEMFPSDCNSSLPDYWSKSEYTAESMLSAGTTQTAAPLHLKSDFCKIGGFREHLPCAQEFDLHLRLALLLGITFRSGSEVGVRIRPVPDSVSRSKSAEKRMPLATADVLLNAFDIIQKNDQLLTRCRDVYATRAINVARKLWKLGEFKVANDLATTAKCIHPQWYSYGYRRHTASRLASILGFEWYEKAYCSWSRIRKLLSPNFVQNGKKARNPSA